MKTMKKIWKYFLNFVVLFLLVTGLIYWSTNLNNKKGTNSTITYTTQENSPIIEVEECTNKKVTGTATNDMGVLIKVMYIKAKLYDINNNLITTEYDEIRYFNVGEKSKFEIKFNSKNVAKVEISAAENKE